MTIESSDSPAFAGKEAASAGLSFRTLSIAALLLLVIGVVGGGWGMSRLLADDGAPTQTKVVDVSGPTGKAAPAAQLAAPGVAGVPQRIAAIPAGDPDTLATRVAELEQRLSRITLQAESASGNVSRAEGLIVVFAVRRALDRALPLGDLDAQLRLRFGDNQPKAVETIIDTARDPVTLERLYAGLDALRPQLSGRGPDGSLWTGFRRELSELFVIRAAEAPSQLATERFERARRYLAGGQVDKAIEEVQAMPGAAAANDWLIDARRYHEARRALDLIETAALVEPGGSPPVTTAGDQPAASAR